MNLSTDWVRCPLPPPPGPPPVAPVAPALLGEIHDVEAWNTATKVNYKVRT